MEITKEVLQLRIAGMMEQLGQLLENTAKVQGAINLGNNLLEYLEAAEAVKPPESEPPESDDGEPPPNENFDGISAEMGPE